MTADAPYISMVQGLDGRWHLPPEKPLVNGRDRAESEAWAEPESLFDDPESDHEADVDDDQPPVDHPVNGATAVPKSAPGHWPAPPDGAAFHGLAGRVVDLADPYTEADRVATLATFLAAFGCALNAGPHARVGPERHPARLFVALVGSSSTSRKGSSWAPIRELLGIADPEFIGHRLLQGLGSGEALIHAVRDGDGDKDQGVPDKRALVFAPEFATILRVMNRQGSLLSGTLKEAWDSGRLQNLVKGSPATATGAHVSVIAHTTADEMARDLTDVDARSGFGNRFIYVAVRRSKYLPSPPDWDDQGVFKMAREVGTALQVARTRSRLSRDPAAERRWCEVYGHLTRDRHGLAGILTSRAEAQVLRLSLVYALLDGATAIGLDHLRAALALWEYAERSATYIFGNRTGDPIADRILAEVANGRRSRADLHDLFGRHVGRERIESTLVRLVDEGRVRRSSESTAGRPIEFVEAYGNAR